MINVLGNLNKELNWLAHRLLVSDRKRRVMVDLQRFKSIILTVNNDNNNNNNNNNRFKLYLFYFNYTESSLNLYTRS